MSHSVANEPPNQCWSKHCLIVLIMRLFSDRIMIWIGVGVLTGCVPVAFSPPARSLPLESSATLAEGDVAVQAAGGVHADGATGGAAAVRGRFGLTSFLEAQVEASYLAINYPHAYDRRSPHVGASRLGLKLAPIEHFAFVAGFGMGGHTHGAFASPDVGLIFAYENRYFVPWLALRGWVSVPINPKTRTVTSDDEIFVLRPYDTFGWQVSTGFRIPLTLDAEDNVRLNLLGGVALGWLHDLREEENLGFFQFETGVEIVFDP